MGTRVACLLTTYNRPTLVLDAIASVREQDDSDLRLIVMDDGSDLRVQSKIIGALRAWSGGRTAMATAVAGGGVIHFDDHATLWLGTGRDAAERKRTISYSRSINIALNALLRDESYLTYLCDDDFFYPESIGARADYLDAHPDVHVVFGRTRSIQYAGEGRRNTWDTSAPPEAGRVYPRPDGDRVLTAHGASARTYWHDEDTRDPQTGLSYVEEGFWQSGAWRYGQPFCCDHNQVMHRRECLTKCGVPWLTESADTGGVQYWGEDLRRWGVGDKAFFTVLGAVHKFHAVDAWCVTKRYHAYSDGVQAGSVRE